MSNGFVEISCRCLMSIYNVQRRDWHDSSKQKRSLREPRESFLSIIRANRSWHPTQISHKTTYPFTCYSTYIEKKERRKKKKKYAIIDTVNVNEISLYTSIYICRIIVKKIDLKREMRKKESRYPVIRVSS